MILNYVLLIDGILLLKLVVSVVLYKSDLKLSDRTYKCNDCGIEIDRDFNASLNLKYATTYKIAQ